jgi:hypothetical protein
MPILPDAALFATRAHDQADDAARGDAIYVGSSRRGAMRKTNQAPHKCPSCGTSIFYVGTGRMRPA